jgi:hypothetical protein
MGSVTYSKVRLETQQMFDKILESYEELNDYQVTFDVLYAFGATDGDGEITKPAITKNGVEFHSNAKVYRLDARAAHNVCAVVYLDGDIWTNSSETYREAIIHSALSSLELKRNKDDEVMLDDLNLPKLKLKKPDIAYFGNSKMLEAFGKESMEYKQFAALQVKINEILLG